MPTDCIARTLGLTFCCFCWDRQATRTAVLQLFFWPRSSIRSQLVVVPFVSRADSDERWRTLRAATICRLQSTWKTSSPSWEEGVKARGSLRPARMTVLAVRRDVTKNTRSVSDQMTVLLEQAGAEWDRKHHNRARQPNHAAPVMSSFCGLMSGKSSRRCWKRPWTR